jgi:Flp pilus assembly protein TadG
MTHRRAGKRSSVGQSVVEFALLSPVAVLLLLIAVDLGRAYFGTVGLTNIARVGANYAALNPTGWQGSGKPVYQARYQELMQADALGIDCTLPSTLPAPLFVDTGPDQYNLGSTVQVSLSCQFTLITPLLSSLIGDGAGHVNLTSSTTFTIRSGTVEGVVVASAVPSAGPTATPTATPTAGPTPTPAPSSSGSPGPTSSPTPTPVPLVLGFYGTPTSTDSSGGGSAGDQVVGIPTLSVTFTNTTTGGTGSCSWDFGDGGTSSSCGDTVTHNYYSRALYNVTLTMSGQSLVKTDYVLVGCKVPAFAGVRVNSAVGNWTAAGFAWNNLSAMDGNGNYKIGYQSLVGGLVNPPGGCAGATILVGE